jgi:hypothetical protein
MNMGFLELLHVFKQSLRETRGDPQKFINTYNGCLIHCRYLFYLLIIFRIEQKSIFNISRCIQSCIA